jgi:hypothetical protein
MVGMLALTTGPNPLPDSPALSLPAPASAAATGPSALDEQSAIRDAAERAERVAALRASRSRRIAAEKAASARQEAAQRAARARAAARAAAAREAARKAAAHVSRPPADSGSYSSAAGWAASPRAVRLRNCESGGNYATNTGNGYYGAYQFNAGTWRGIGGSGLPSNASKAEQDYRAWLLWKSRGWQPWPHCGYV